MKHKPGLDVDIIGGHAPLTKEEAIAISEYIKAKKAKRARLLQKKQIRVSKKTKAAMV